MMNVKNCLVAGLLGVAVLASAGCQSPQLKLRDQGIVQYKSGDYTTSYDTFSKALGYNQFNAENNYYAGMSAYQLGRYETASYHLKLAWQANPSLGDVKEALTEVLIRLGRPDDALDYLDRDAEFTAKTKDPRWLKTISKRPYVWQTEEGMYLRKAEDRCRVGRVYERLGDMDNARLNFEKAVTLAPKDTYILTQVGSYYARVGQADKAAGYFTKAYNIDPKTPGLQEAIAKNNMTVK